jgi:DNA polymerase-1
MSDYDAKRWVLFGEGTPSFPIDSESGRTLRTKPLESQHLKVISRTPKEKVPQVTQAVLEIYEGRGNEMASLMLQWSEYEKLRGTFVEGITSMLHPHGDELPTIHTSFAQHRTVTGRLVSVKPNLQQLPRGTVIRDLFVAGPGHVLIVADYDQIELRCLALLADERTMISIFKEGRDIHREAAAVAMRVAIEAVTGVQRDVGKTLNFATGYGAGAERIARVAKTTKQRGQRFLDRYYATFSRLEPWKAKVLAAAMKTGVKTEPLRKPPYVTIPPIGRLRRLPDLYRFQQDDRYLRYRAERQAINAVVQGFASNITKLAMIDLHTRLQPYPAHMLVQVHDEIVIQVEEAYLDTVMPIVTETMTGVLDSDSHPILGQEIPLIVSSKAGYTWASAKGK